MTEGKLGSHDGCTIEDEVSQEFLDRIPGGLFRYRADDEGGESTVSISTRSSARSSLR